MNRPVGNRPRREAPTCRNCGAHAPDEFCSKCGQDTDESLPSFGEFAHQLALDHFAAEGSFLRTLRALFARPGFLTSEYLQGRKVRYLPPLRLYLTCSVVFFLALKLSLALTINSAVAPVSLDLGNEHVDIQVSLVFFGAERHRDDSFTCNFPQSLCDRLRAKFYGPPDERQSLLRQLPQEFLSHMSTAMFLLVPVFALWLKLAFRARTYGEHLVFALHLHSLWFLWLLLLLPPISDWVKAILLLYVLILSFLALRRVYGGPAWRTIVKGTLVTAAYGTSLLLTTAVLGIATLIF